MDLLKNNIEKICSFYVSDWHLVTMILPYINKQINEKANIITILENDIEENVKTLISKLNLKNEENILNIDWKGKQTIKYPEIKKIMKTLKSGEELNIILINGNKNYIDIINKNIDQYFSEYQINDKVHIKIINCYEVGEFNFNIKEILENHDKILNTSGEKEILDVFEGYA